LIEKIDDTTIRYTWNSLWGCEIFSQQTNY